MSFSHLLRDAPFYSPAAFSPSRRRQQQPGTPGSAIQARAQRRRSTKPLVDPYTSLSSNDFDSFVDGVSSKIRDALTYEPNRDRRIRRGYANGDEYWAQVGGRPGQFVAAETSQDVTAANVDASALDASVQTEDVEPQVEHGDFITEPQVQPLETNGLTEEQTIQQLLDGLDHPPQTLPAQSFAAEPIASTSQASNLDPALLQDSLYPNLQSFGDNVGYTLPPTESQAQQTSDVTASLYPSLAGLQGDTQAPFQSNTDGDLDFLQQYTNAIPSDDLAAPQAPIVTDYAPLDALLDMAKGDAEGATEAMHHIEEEDQVEQALDEALLEQIAPPETFDDEASDIAVPDVADEADSDSQVDEMDASEAEEEEPLPSPPRFVKQKSASKEASDVISIGSTSDEEEEDEEEGEEEMLQDEEEEDLDDDEVELADEIDYEDVVEDEDDIQVAGSASPAAVGGTAANARQASTSALEPTAMFFREEVLEEEEVEEITPPPLHAAQQETAPTLFGEIEESRAPTKRAVLPANIWGRMDRDEQNLSGFNHAAQVGDDDDEDSDVEEYHRPSEDSDAREWAKLRRKMGRKQRAQDEQDAEDRYFDNEEEGEAEQSDEEAADDEEGYEEDESEESDHGEGSSSKSYRAVQKRNLATSQGEFEDELDDEALSGDERAAKRARGDLDTRVPIPAFMKRDKETGEYELRAGSSDSEEDESDEDEDEEEQGDVAVPEAASLTVDEQDTVEVDAANTEDAVESNNRGQKETIGEEIELGLRDTTTVPSQTTSEVIQAVSPVEVLGNGEGASTSATPLELAQAIEMEDAMEVEKGRSSSPVTIVEAAEMSFDPASLDATSKQPAEAPAQLASDASLPDENPALQAENTDTALVDVQPEASSITETPLPSSLAELADKLFEKSPPQALATVSLADTLAPAAAVPEDEQQAGADASSAPAQSEVPVEPKSPRRRQRSKTPSTPATKPRTSAEPRLFASLGVSPEQFTLGTPRRSVTPNLPVEDLPATTSDNHIDLDVLQATNAAEASAINAENTVQPVSLPVPAEVDPVHRQTVEADASAAVNEEEDDYRDRAAEGEEAQVVASHEKQSSPQMFEDHHHEPPPAEPTTEAPEQHAEEAQVEQMEDIDMTTDEMESHSPKGAAAPAVMDEGVAEEEQNLQAEPIRLPAPEPKAEIKEEAQTSNSTPSRVFNAIMPGLWDPSTPVRFGGQSIAAAVREAYYDPQRAGNLRESLGSPEAKHANIMPVKEEHQEVENAVKAEKDSATPVRRARVSFAADDEEENKPADEILKEVAQEGEDEEEKPDHVEGEDEQPEAELISSPGIKQEDGEPTAAVQSDDYVGDSVSQALSEEASIPVHADVSTLGQDEEESAGEDEAASGAEEQSSSSDESSAVLVTSTKSQQAQSSKQPQPSAVQADASSESDAETSSSDEEDDAVFVTSLVRPAHLRAGPPMARRGGVQTRAGTARGLHKGKGPAPVDEPVAEEDSESEEESVASKHTEEAEVAGSVGSASADNTRSATPSRPSTPEVDNASGRSIIANLIVPASPILQPATPMEELEVSSILMPQTSRPRLHKHGSGSNTGLRQGRTPPRHKRGGSVSSRSSAGRPSAEPVSGTSPAPVHADAEHSQSLHPGSSPIQTRSQCTYRKISIPNPYQAQAQLQAQAQASTPGRRMSSRLARAAAGERAGASESGIPATSTSNGSLAAQQDYPSHFIFLVPGCSTADRKEAMQDENIVDLGVASVEEEGSAMALNTDEDTEHGVRVEGLPDAILQSLIRVVGLEIFREGACEILSPLLQLPAGNPARRDNFAPASERKRRRESEQLVMSPPNNGDGSQGHPAKRQNTGRH